MNEDILGKEYENSNGRVFVVTGIEKDIRNKTVYKIRFIQSGYETIVYKQKITQKKIKDVYEPILCDIAYIGNVSYKGNEKYYNIWRGIIRRCYDPRRKDYKSYGGKGVAVSDRWHCFEYFLEDICKVDGYDEQMFLEGKIELDKDIKSHNSKLYSLETCTFVTPKENSKHKDVKNTKFTAITPNGETIVSEKNIAYFAKENDLRESGVINVLKGRQKTTKGWRFYYTKE